jgi:UDP-N-acetylmuramoylalanine--D-glutamate ligase
MKKSLYQKYFKGKDVTVMGIGLLGDGIRDIKILAESKANIIVTDQNDEKKLKKSLRPLKRFKNIEYRLGKHSVLDFRSRDMILKGPKASLKNKYIEEARKENTPIHMSFGLVLDILRKEKIKTTIIGVTGTKGKSTTTSLIELILKNAGLSYHLGGNIRGVDNLPLLKKIKDNDILLVELDSWQLQGLHTVGLSPDIAVFTNFFADHQDYYEHSMKDYFYDKSAIFKYQRRGKDHIVLSQNVIDAMANYYPKRIPSKKHLAQFSDLPKSWEYQIFGRHNEQNLALAFHVGKLLEIPATTLKKSLAEFKSISGRFQLVADKKDAFFFNDSSSTTPKSSILALEALVDRYPSRQIFLLAGGADKSSDYHDFAIAIEQYTTYAYLFSGTATDKIKDAFSETFENFTETISMNSAMRMISKQLKDDSIVILSPGASAQGVFKNESDRSDQFVRLVKKIF